MRRMWFDFPGDPRCIVEFMSKEEFLQKYPRYPTEIHGADGSVEYIQIPPDAILCDSCNAVPVAEICVIDGSHGYCEKCTKRWKKYFVPCGD